MSSEKFVICPHCGAITDKNGLYCGTCGGNMKEQKKGAFEPSNTLPQPPQDSYRPGNSAQSGYYKPPPVYGQQTTYAQPQSYIQEQIENKLKFAWLFAWITFCMGGTMWLIFTIFFALEAKKLGSTDSKIKQSLIIAVVGVVVQTIFKTLFLIFIYIPLLYSTSF